MGGFAFAPPCYVSARNREPSLMTSDTDAARRKRLRYRAAHRGMKELDILIGRFAETHLGAFDAAQLDRFEQLLEVPEPILYDWITGNAEPAPPHDHDVTRLLLAFKLHTPNS